RSLARGASPAPFPLSPPLPSFLPLSPPVGLSPRAPSLERHVHDHQRLQELQQEDHRRSLLSRWARGVWWGCGPLRRLPTHPPLMPTSSHSPLPVPRFRAIPQYLPAGGAVDPFRALPTHPPHTPTSSHSPLPVPRFQGYPPVPPRWRGKCTTTSDFKACSKKIIGAHYFAEGLVASGGSVDPSAEYLSPRDASDHGTWCAGKKIIGARYFAEGLVASGGAVDPSTEYMSPRDASDHGTWCEGAAAGNPVKVSGGGVQFGTASGMAPRARIAVYKAIWVQGKLAIGSDSDVFAAVDRAVADGVDVLSMSVAINEETYFKHLAMLRAARKQYWLCACSFACWLRVSAEHVGGDQRGDLLQASGDAQGCQVGRPLWTVGRPLWTAGSSRVCLLPCLFPPSPFPPVPTSPLCLPHLPTHPPPEQAGAFGRVAGNSEPPPNKPQALTNSSPLPPIPSHPFPPLPPVPLPSSPTQAGRGVCIIGSGQQRASPSKPQALSNSTPNPAPLPSSPTQAGRGVCVTGSRQQWASPRKPQALSHAHKPLALLHHRCSQVGLRVWDRVPLPLLSPVFSPIALSLSNPFPLPPPLPPPPSPISHPQHVQPSLAAPSQAVTGQQAELPGGDTPGRQHCHAPAASGGWQVIRCCWVHGFPGRSVCALLFSALQGTLPFALQVPHSLPLLGCHTATRRLPLVGAKTSASQAEACVPYS
ncbi:unnamed protein product, partial [Closterium sp. NIES-53]